MMKPAKAAMDLGVLVSDITASLNFYENLLGMEKEGETPLPIGTMHRMKFGDSLFKLVESKKELAKGPSGMAAQLGFRYVTFQVTNISEICEALKKKDVYFSIPETELMPGVKIAMVKDPDGNTVEFSQVDK